MVLCVDTSEERRAGTSQLVPPRYKYLSFKLIILMQYGVKDSFITQQAQNRTGTRVADPSLSTHVAPPVAPPAARSRSYTDIQFHPQVDHLVMSDIMMSVLRMIHVHGALHVPLDPKAAAQSRRPPLPVLCNLYLSSVLCLEALHTDTTDR